MEFSFPYEPYDIQLNLMREIRECIEAGQVGIFESPTGTGKSLSVLCSTMTWLEDHEKACKEQVQREIAYAGAKIASNDDSDDWVEAHRRKLDAQQIETSARDKEDNLNRIAERLEKAKKGIVEVGRKRRNRADDGDSVDVQLEDEEHDELAPPDEYNSDGEGTQETEKDDEDEIELKAVKIFYASRTHSQLEQLVDELEKTRFRPRIVTCASRATLCVNEDVRRLRVNHLINERCMELRKNSSKSNAEKRLKDECGKAKKKKCGGSTSCAYYSTTAIEEVVNGILAAKLTKTLQVTKQGKTSIGCPYFATRKSIPLCQLVLLPYQLILHGPTRKAWGIELEGNVVILDEAHNVLDTICSLYSAEIGSQSLSTALKLIREYIDTYKFRLKAKNLLYMRQLQLVAHAMLLCLTNVKDAVDEVLTIQALVIKLNITEVNLFKLAAYVERTDLCKKFHGFFIRSQRNALKKENEKPKLSGIARLLAKNVEKTANEVPTETSTEDSRPTPSPLFSLKSFIDALTNGCADGRVVVARVGAAPKMRYMLLNPAERLREVVSGSRSTVLVGGTMEPAQLLVETLSKGGLTNEIRRFSCNHVIDDDQLLALTIDKTVDGRSFQLTYQTRTNEQVLKSLALTLNSLLPLVPNGVVVFLPSYDFLNSFQQHLAALGLLAKIEEKKAVFLESRSPTSDAWEKFSRAAKTPKGAVLFAVVGGKLSEGINFSDELGRAVVMIGLPYPNKASIELREKMKFLDSQMAGGGSMLYESLCMHAVNQAIGRAIRHRRDYAAVYLIDERFGKEATRCKLSAWIGRRLRVAPGFGDVVRSTRQFFADKTK